MRTKKVGNKVDKILMVVKSAEASSEIPRGTPLVLAANATDDGLAVVLPSAAGNAKTGAFPFGVATEAMAAGAYSEAIVFGYCAYAILVRGTRAASTDSWTSSGSFASGAILMIDIVNNAFISTVASLAASSLAPMAVLMQSQVSFAASASSTADSRTANTIGVKVFVRML